MMASLSLSPLILSKVSTVALVESHKRVTVYREMLQARRNLIFPRLSNPDSCHALDTVTSTLKQRWNEREDRSSFFHFFSSPPLRSTRNNWDEGKRNSGYFFFSHDHRLSNNSRIIVGTLLSIASAFLDWASYAIKSVRERRAFNFLEKCIFTRGERPLCHLTKAG